MDLKGLSMSELIAAYNTLAVSKGAPLATEFKNLAAARAAINHLAGQPMNQETQNPPVDEATGTPPFDPSTITEGQALAMAAAAAANGGTDPSKYSTVGKRGPNQGIGEFAKQLLTAGVPTGEVLKQVHIHFPTAKTSASCIAYYKAALKNPNLGKKKAAQDPAALRAKAEELMAAAAAAEQAAVDLAKKQAEQAAAAAAAAQTAVAAAAQVAAQIKAQQEAAAQAQAAAAAAQLQAQQEAAAQAAAATQEQPSA